MDHPSISVIIPSFNQDQYIEETLVSVLGQEYSNLEVLVIDGGSTDRTIEILKKYSNKISYWHSKPDKGQADAINQGIHLSSGEVICWLNSDDMYLPGTLLDVGRRFCGRTEQSYLIYGSAITLQQKNGESSSIVQPGATTNVSFDAFDLTYYDYITQPSSFWTRKLWQATGELNINYKYVLDWEWFIRAAQTSQFEYVPRFYSIYRQHPLHKTGNGGKERRQEIFDVVKTYASDYWIDLYIEVEKIYPRIFEFVSLGKIPKRHLLLPLFFPELASKLKDIQDLYKVLSMYG
jgi:glycosyltransferase involved in cell wall biosynthesis